MKKKKFDLTSEIVKVETTNDLANSNIQMSGFKKTKSKKMTNITIVIETGLYREYKSWCSLRGFKIKEAFIKGYEALKKEYH